MVVFKILDVKKFMSGFLAGTMLDSYRMASGSITTFCTFRIDGTYHAEFFRDKSEISDASNINETSAAHSIADATTASNAFNVAKASIASTVSGNKPNPDSSEEKKEKPSFVTWKSVRPFCFSIVKGKHTPLAFKFVFYFPDNYVPAFCQRYQVPFDPNDAPGLCLNLKFDSTGLFLTTGISRRTFSLDRSADEAWDKYVEDRLKKIGIASEEV